MLLIQNSTLHFLLILVEKLAFATMGHGSGLLPIAVIRSRRKKPN